MSILYFILYGVLIWIGWGISIAFLKMFVYFRGPQHMVEMYMTHPSTLKSALVMTKSSKGKSLPIVLGFLIASVIFPPLFTLIFINDILIFSWYPYLDSKTKKPD